jgi:hypothetical protein
MIAVVPPTSHSCRMDVGNVQPAYPRFQFARARTCRRRRKPRREGITGVALPFAGSCTLMGADRGRIQRRCSKSVRCSEFRKHVAIDCSAEKSSSICRIAREDHAKARPFWPARSLRSQTGDYSHQSAPDHLSYPANKGQSAPIASEPALCRSVLRSARYETADRRRKLWPATNAVLSASSKAAAGSGTVVLDAEPPPVVRPKLVRHVLKLAAEPSVLRHTT